MNWQAEHFDELRDEITRLRADLDQVKRYYFDTCDHVAKLRRLLEAARPYIEYCADDYNVTAVRVLREIDALGVLRTNCDGAIDGGASLLPRSGA